MSDPRVLILGDAMLDLYPEPAGADLSEADRFVPRPGGGCANVAIHLARGGRDVTFMGAIARDPVGDRLVQSLLKEGVKVQAARTLGKTPVNLIALDAHGVPSFYNYAGGQDSIPPEHIDNAQLDSVDAFHFSSTTIIAPGAVEATERALSGLKPRAMISCDLNLRGGRWRAEPALRARMLDALRFARVVKATERELQIITQTRSIEDGVEALAALGPQLILISQGDQGCRWWLRGRWSQTPAEPTEVVDSTGAGDAFIAAVMHRLYDSDDALSNAEAAVLAGCRAGAEACRTLGAT